MDLIAGVFGLAEFAGDEDGAAGAVYFFGVPVGLVEGENEDLLQHFDDVIVGVIVVIEEDDPVQRDELFPFEDFGFWRQRRVRHDNGREPQRSVCAIARRATTTWTGGGGRGIILGIT